MEEKNIFEMERHVDEEHVKKVVKEKLDKSWIKTRKQGGTTLSYIGGHTVIHLLNKAFGFGWSFEIVREDVVESVPKPATEWVNRRKEYKRDSNGQIIMEAQPPVVKVLGRLSVPGYGVKEQYGSKVLIGGATEQESAFKSASTDAMKKCASLFGIGLELWGEEGLEDDEPVETPEVKQVAKQAPAPQQQAPAQQQPAPQKQAPVKQAEPAQQTQAQEKPAPQPQTGAQTSTGQQSKWSNEDINRLKELKMILGIQDNNELTPYMVEFFDNPDATYRNVNPDNIKGINVFLTSKAENI